MLEKNTYYAIQERSKTTGKYYAYMMKVSNLTNLLYAFKPCSGCELSSVNACDSRKQARELVDFWNQCAKDNGRYLFDEAPAF